MEPAQRSLSVQQTLVIIAIVFVLIILPIFVLAYLGNQPETVAVDPAQAAREAADKIERDRELAAKQAERRHMGFHCLSPWDGSNDSVVEQVKQGLRDPNSFEHADTRIGPITGGSEGRHPLFMTYRARNGFGGMNVGRVAAFVDPQTCQATIASMTER